MRRHTKTRHYICWSVRGRRATVLVVVLWVCGALVAIALYFGNAMVLEYRASDNEEAGAEAAQTIEGAQRYIAYMLTNLEQPGYMPDRDSYSCEEVPVGNGVFWLIGRDPTGTVAEGTQAFGLVDEASKLNLNTTATLTLEILEVLPGMTPELAAAIMDWRDSDEDLTEGGAESSNYLLNEPSYNCKNSSFETVEELHLVMGVTRDLLYGEDTNRNGVLDPSEDDADASPPADSQDGKLNAGLLEYLTVYSREPNKRADGSARINIRTATQELQQLLSDTFGQERATAIQQAVGPGAGVGSVLGFFARSGMTPAEFAQIEDALTVSDEAYLVGRVNVNAAPVEVLACLPGIGETYAAQLVSHRQGKTLTDLQSVAWLMEVLDPDSAAQAGLYVTTRTYQFTADIAGLGHDGRGFRREVLVFDTSGTEPVVVFRRDQTRLGWPLGKAVYEKYNSIERQ